MSSRWWARQVSTVMVGVGGVLIGWWLGRPSTHSTAAVASERPVEVGDDRDKPRSATSAMSERGDADAAAPTRQAIELEPGAPGYDGVRAAAWLGVGSVGLFEREPIDPRWAPDMEREMVALAADFLARGKLSGEVVAASCRTATCQVVIDTTEPDAATAYFQVFAPLGAMISPGVPEVVDGNWRMTFTTVYDAEHHAPAAFRAFLHQYAAPKAADWPDFRRRI